MKNILFLQKSLQPPGGGNAVAAWIIQALKDEYSITVLTWDAVDTEEINRFYGTSLQSSDFTVIRPGPAVLALVRVIPDPHGIQRLGFLLRIWHRIRDRFDLAISADNEMDFGERGIQYFHYPALNELYRYHSVRGRSLKDKTIAVIRYHWRPWRLVSGFSFERMKQNLTLVNSDWTGIAAKNMYGIDTKTVYPPISGHFPRVEWKDKSDDIVVIGRFVVEKCLESLIEIVSNVRRHVPGIQLIFIGTPGSRRQDRQYYRNFLSQVERHDWIQVEEDLSRENMIELISKFRYGLHGFVNEHFGMGVAEMVVAGCLPFLPDGGGQREIVNFQADLLYRSRSDAVSKIVATMQSPPRQRQLQKSLESMKHRFSVTAFVHEFRSIVQNFDREHIVITGTNR